MPTKTAPTAVRAKSATAASVKRVRGEPAESPISPQAAAASPSDQNDSEGAGPKAAKPRKVKFKTYSHTMPEHEHAAILELKQKIIDAGGPKTKKSELIRAAMQLFIAMPVPKVKAALLALGAKAPGK